MLKPGKVIRKFEIKGKGVVFRCPKKGDEKALLRHINTLVEEKAYIGMQTKQTMKQEKDFLRDTLKGLRKGNKIHINSPRFPAAGGSG